MSGLLGAVARLAQLVTRGGRTATKGGQTATKSGNRSKPTIGAQRPPKATAGAAAAARTTGQRVAAGAVAGGIVAGGISAFLASDDQDDQETLDTTTSKTAETSIKKSELGIIKFPLDIENSPVPHVLIKIYDTETGSVTVTDSSTRTFTSGVVNATNALDDLNAGTVLGAVLGAKGAITPAGLLALGGKWKIAASVVAAGGALGGAVVGSGAFEAAAGATVNALGNQVNISNTSDRYKQLISNFALKRNIDQLRVAIALLMPETLAVSYQNKFDELSFTQAAGGAGMLAQAIGSDLGKSADGANPYLIETAGRAAQGLLSEEFKRIGLFATTGRTLNPQPEMIYNSPALREFVMDFRLVPRNPAEAAQINVLLKQLKFFASPQIPSDSGGRYFIPPAQFELEFYDANNNINQFLFRTKKCVLEDIAIDFTGGGSFASFYDGSPVETRLSLRFRETVFIDREAVNQGY